jgi:hypothetical protein
MAMTELANITATENVDLLALGLNQVTYMRRGKVDGVKGFIIYAADGSSVGFAQNRTQALVAIMHNDMELVPVH